MAVTFESTETVTRGSSYFLATQDIDIDAKNNGRHVLPDISWLEESIKKEGQHTPCTVRKNGKRALMVDGHSRWRAICNINKGRKPEERLKVWCVFFEGNEVDALVAGFQQNRERNDLTAVDEGYFVARMQRYGKTLPEIGEICHEDEKWCQQRLSLVSLTPEGQAAVADHSLNIPAAIALSKLAAEEQRRFLQSGAKLKAADIKRAQAEASGKKVTPKKPSVAQVYAIIHGIAAHDEYPEGLKESCTKDELCEWIMGFISGDPVQNTIK